MDCRISNNSFKSLITLIAVMAFPMILFFIYWQGLNGGFLLDDYFNFEALYTEAPYTSWSERFNAALNNGIASNIGRPVSLLTFLLDANNWPAEPRPFKVTNLILHILNSLLLFRLTFKILIISQKSKYQDALLISFISSLAWAIHPLHVSSVLYIIQRMTLLSGTFVLIAMNLYVYAYELSRRGNAGKSFIIFFVCFTLVYPIAILCKENAALLPVFLLILINTVLLQSDSDLKGKSDFRKFRILSYSVFLMTIAFLMCAALTQIGAFMKVYDSARDFTMYERSLTESRVIAKYLYLLFFPQSQTPGIYNDAHVISTSIFSPLSTIFSLILITSLVFFSLIFRARYRYLAFCLLFFFSGHLVESTIIPLEIYFEHRNYVPSFFLFLPIVIIVSRWSLIGYSKYVILSIFIFGLAATTYSRSNLWGDPEKLKIVWAMENPASARANIDAANAWVTLDQPQQAEKQLLEGLKTSQNDGMLGLTLLALNCRYPFGGFDVNQRVLPTIRASQIRQYEYVRLLSDIVDRAEDNRCYLGLEQISLVIDEIISQFILKRKSADDLFFLQARVSVLQNKYPEALGNMVQGVRGQNQCEKLILGMSFFGSLGQPDYGLKLLKEVTQDPGLIMCERSSFENASPKSQLSSSMVEVRRLEALLRSDLRLKGE